jgi:hypothetical protein
MTEFNWNDYAKHVDALRDMGCAVVTITPEDVESVFSEEMDPHEAHAWLRYNHDDIEGAILGDYWDQDVRDVYAWKSARD